MYYFWNHILFCAAAVVLVRAMDGLNTSSMFNVNVNSSPSSNSTMTEASGKSPIIKSEPTLPSANSVTMGTVTMTAPSPSTNMSSSAKGTAAAAAAAAAAALTNSTNSERKILDKRRLADLAKEVDPLLQLDDDVEEMILQVADDFIDNAVSSACELAKHRKSNTLEAKDLHLIFERNYNIWVPGYGTEEVRPYKKAYTTEAHRQRMALIKKSLKKN